MKALSSPTLQGMAWMLLASLAGTLIDTGVKALSTTMTRRRSCSGACSLACPLCC